MGAPICWTPEMLALLRHLRHDEHLSAADAGRRLHCSARAVYNAEHAHGLRRKVAPAETPDRAARVRDPLPAGHPLSWNLICAGLACLDGAAWPG